MNASQCDKSRFRFSLQTLCFLVAYAGIICAWATWFPASPLRNLIYHANWLLVLSISVIAGTGIAQWFNSRMCAFDAVLVGLLITAVSVVDGYLGPYSSMGPPTLQNIARELRYEVYSAAVYRTAVPVAVSLPVLYFVFTRGAPVFSPASRWLALAVGIAVIDLVLLGVGVVCGFDKAATM